MAALLFKADCQGPKGCAIIKIAKEEAVKCAETEERRPGYRAGHAAPGVFPGTIRGVLP